MDLIPKLRQREMRNEANRNVSTNNLGEFYETWTPYSTTDK